MLLQHGSEHQAQNHSGGIELILLKVVTEDTTDEEIVAAPRGYLVRYAKTAARFRKELIERYGEKGKIIRFAEAYEVCEYGTPLSDEMKKELFD